MTIFVDVPFGWSERAMSWNQAACQGESQRLRFQLALSKAQSARAMNVVSPKCATVSDLDVFD